MVSAGNSPNISHARDNKYSTTVGMAIDNSMTLPILFSQHLIKKNDTPYSVKYNYNSSNEII